VQRDVGPVEHKQQLVLVGVGSGDGVVELGKAGDPGEDPIEPLLQRRPAGGCGIVLVELEIGWNHQTSWRCTSTRRCCSAARQARFEEVAALHVRGWSQSAISRSTGLDRSTIRTWLQAGRPPSWSKPAYGSAVDVHADYLRRRWSEGCTNTGV
jgi:hypothetical protein